MPIYRVEIPVNATSIVEVEADSEQQAEDTARVIAATGEIVNTQANEYACWAITVKEAADAR